MIVYKDFVPEQTRAAGFLTAGKYATFDSAVEAANAWLAENSVTLVTFETVVLPNIWDRDEKGSDDTSLHTNGEFPSRWHQFVRVWFRED